jgi:hypothetical protein
MRGRRSNERWRWSGEGTVGRSPTLAEFVEEYLAQHEDSPVTLEKLRFLLARAVQSFRRLLP